MFVFHLRLILHAFFQIYKRYFIVVFLSLRVFAVSFGAAEFPVKDFMGACDNLINQIDIFRA